METVYLLIQCDMGSEIDIIEKMTQLSQVKEVRGTYGIYDIFVKIQTNTREEMEDLITHEIRKVPKIRSTITLHPILSQGGR